jgi:hypothetical protein
VHYKCAVPVATVVNGCGRFVPVQCMNNCCAW